MTKKEMNERINYAHDSRENPFRKHFQLHILVHKRILLINLFFILFKMENTYISQLLDGTEEGFYLALDLGGTNFRQVSNSAHRIFQDVLTVLA